MPANPIRVARSPYRPPVVTPPFLRFKRPRRTSEFTLTRRQAETLAAIRAYEAGNGVAPTLAVVACALAVAVPVAARLADTLARRGYVVLSLDAAPLAAARVGLRCLPGVAQ
jgi:hypothetical protein